MQNPGNHPRLSGFVLCQISIYLIEFFFAVAKDNCFVLMKCPSCTAANVAMAATMEIGITDQNMVGAARKRNNPVSLLAHVCGKQNRLQTTRAET